MTDLAAVSHATGFGRALPGMTLGLLMIACGEQSPSALAATDPDLGPAEVFCNLPLDQIHQGTAGKDFGVDP